VLPPGVPKLAVEAGASLGWDRYADATVAIDTFGASAPGAQVLAELGFTPEHVADRARELLGHHRGDGAAGVRADEPAGTGVSGTATRAGGEPRGAHGIEGGSR
jgi:hypothetical protein